MNITILSPVKRESRMGNGVTVRRWERILGNLGHEVTVTTELNGRESPDCLLALHARRSAEAIRGFRQRLPDIPIILALTGTDLYRDIREDEQALGSLDVADRLIVLQERGLDELEPRHREKSNVIHQSIESVPWSSKPLAKYDRNDFNVVQLAHLRPVKDPFLLVDAVADLPETSNVEAWHLGQERHEGFADEADSLNFEHERYHWLGGRDRRVARQWLSEADLMVIASRLEGGAHVVSEAIACETPVLASDIPGNVGLLGEDYDGYFDVGEKSSLRSGVETASSQERYCHRLIDQLRERQYLMDPVRERNGWEQLLATIGNRSPA